MTRMRRRFGLWAVGLAALVLGSASAGLTGETLHASFPDCISIYNYYDVNDDVVYSGLLCPDGFFEFVLDWPG